MKYNLMQRDWFIGFVIPDFKHSKGTDLPFIV